MTFKLKEMTIADDDFVANEINEKFDKKFGYFKKGHSEPWLIDSERNFFIFCMRWWDPREPRTRYILSLDGEIAVIKLNKPWSLDVVATILFMSETLSGREVEVQALFAEGFQIGAPAFVGHESEFGPVQITFKSESEGK